MAVTVYKSDDASAPILTGTDGEFVALLQACLVIGYGAKAPAGWSRPFTGTNKAAFRPGAGNQFYDRITDSEVSGTSRIYRHRGHVTMSDIDTGTELFPTAAQAATPGGATYNTGLVPRPWIIIADSRTAYFFTDPSGLSLWQGCMFGDFFSYVGVGDGYRTAIVDTNLDKLVNSISSTIAGHYVPRAYNQVGTALLIGKHGDRGRSLSSTFLKGGVQYPNLPSGAIHLSPVYLHEIASPVVRGKLRGMWHWLHSLSGIGSGDTFSGTGDFTGKTFLLLPSSNGGVFCVETSNTWDTN